MLGCGKVCWGVGEGVRKCLGMCEEVLGKVWESTLGYGKGKGRCVGVKGKVLGGVGKCWGRCEGCGEVL